MPGFFEKSLRNKISLVLTRISGYVNFVLQTMRKPAITKTFQFVVLLDTHYFCSWRQFVCVHIWETFNYFFKIMNDVNERENQHPWMNKKNLDLHEWNDSVQRSRIVRCCMWNRYYRDGFGNMKPPNTLFK